MNRQQNSLRPYKILFVCLGNICRSPAAEGIFLHKVEQRNLSNLFEVDSAGTSGYHQGELPDKRMRHHGQLRGYCFNSRSRKFVASDFDKFDYIVCMDESNVGNVTQLAVTLQEKDKIYRMTDFLRQKTHDHVPDPYYSGAEGFELVIDLLEDACEGLLDYLTDKSKTDLP